MTTIDTAMPAPGDARLVDEPHHARARQERPAPKPARAHRGRRDPAARTQERSSDHAGADRAGPKLGEVDAGDDQGDIARAWRTVPRGANESDARPEPGVDVDVWLLHVRYARSRQPAVRARL